MSRAARIATVVRVRQLQARMAEVDAVACRRAEQRSRDAVRRSIESVDARSAPGSIPTPDATGLVRRSEILRAAVGHVEDRTAELASAGAATRDAESAWLAAHRRQDGVERLAERDRDADAVEQTRTEQKELDDLVSVRHGHSGGHG